ncbi:MAG TPA: response regulator [Candidatus Binataceae bacterium]|nr:response regulator [Candidatus Binataceae bacterium]
MPRALRVLLVEDHDTTRESFRLLLETWLCEVDTAENGDLGLRLALNGNYDAVILDLHLPGLDGLEVGRVLAALMPRPYLFAYTAFSREQDRERTREAGFDMHLAKGSAIGIDQLKTRLNQLKAGMSQHKP